MKGRGRAGRYLILIEYSHTHSVLVPRTHRSSSLCFCLSVSLSFILIAGQQDKRSQPIAVSGRMTRATKLKPRLELSHRVSVGGPGGVVVSPTASRNKRLARDAGGNKRLHKSPRTSIDRGET